MWILKVELTVNAPEMSNTQIKKLQHFLLIYRKCIKTTIYTERQNTFNIQKDKTHLITVTLNNLVII
jgi:hypothetical protein